MTIQIYHNPRCSKSRETLGLLQQRGIEPEIILYLESPPSPETLKQLLAAAGFSEPRQLMRRNEEIYKTLGLADKTLTEDQLLAAMASHPKLIERPLVVNGDRARLGRPPEQVLEILDC
ncbi:MULTISPECIES: arsenate reductase (glutaredoxin) [Tatumella]|uniref:Arsenate reductase n=2 Tax=Tatumella ptyseos TaxID=82987 RepID=A0A085JHV2_9GAMM|nr:MULTISPECIES: arsenate reductase (glutaredoxin) [Tatumella]KFD20048.1 arsenate reductase [Tatumella ptyseos ATCC 33301]SQK75874.1 arsenate reductase [Tatumella ptyseos]